jgi:hypothetical protein
MSEKKKQLAINIFVAFFLLIIVLSGSFLYWLVADDLVDEVHLATKEYDDLQESGNEADAQQLFQSVISGREKLNPYWLNLIRLNHNGYVQLSSLMRVLKYDPSIESVYSEIGKFIEVAPPAFQNEVKKRYLTDLNQIPGIHEDWLLKYNLNIEPDDDSRTEN